MTIDELARRARTTTRNVRALQTIGLVPPPVMSGRKGVYERGHLDRLRAVLRLQSDGFSLAAIGALLRAREEGLTLEDVLGLGPGTAATDESARDPYGMDGWSLPPRGSLLAVVPSNVLGQAG